VPGAREIFLAVVDSPADEWDARVDDACGGDERLREEVERLLRASKPSQRYFRELAQRIGLAGLVDDSASPPADSASVDGAPVAGVGSEVGPYRITEAIGSGGMGSVWRAERIDGRYESTVAIKLLRLSGGGAAARRFELEGRYLARLTHPHIARLLDAGVTVDGTPYLVLEYVEGVPIDRYCDSLELEVVDRISLFLKVLDAVSHAHAHLIVHRDLKPSNIFVDADGTVKLLDFGIAKLLASETDRAFDITREVGSSLTPAFASPEQLEDGAISTSTDVYSAGLVLALLLAGRTPRTEAGSSLVRIQESARKDPPKLSELFERGSDGHEIARRRGTTAGALERSLRGDLDNILRRALAFDPRERYTTTGELAADLTRHLRNEPVTAQPPTVGYRVRKFVRRHRGGVVVSCLALIALVSAAGTAVWQAFEARRQRDVAIFEQRRSQANQEFFSLLLEEVGPADTPLTSVDLLDRGADMLARQYGTEDAFVGRLHYDLSVRYGNLGQDQRQYELLEEAETIARRENDGDLLAATLCTRILSDRTYDPALARSEMEEVESVLAGTRHHSLATVVNCARTRAALAESDGDREAAISVILEALEIVEVSPVVSTHLHGVLLNDLGRAYLWSNRVADSLETMEKLRAHLLNRGRGGTVGYLTVLANYGTALASAGEVRAQDEIWKEVAERARELERVGRTPPAFVSRRAFTESRMGRFEQALALFEESRGSVEAAGDRFAVAMVDLNMGQALSVLGRYEEAEARFDASESELSKNPGRHAGRLRSIRLARAKLHQRLGQIDEARAIVDSVLAEIGYPEKRDSSILSSALRIATAVELADERFDVAEAYATEQVDSAVARARRRDWSADVGSALVQRAKARLGKDAIQKAIIDLELAIVDRLARQRSWRRPPKCC